MSNEVSKIDDVQTSLMTDIDLLPNFGKLSEKTRKFFYKTSKLSLKNNEGNVEYSQKIMNLWKTFSFGGYQNINNSCYLDSVLVALFASFSDIIHKILYIEPKNIKNPLCQKDSLLNFQNELKMMYDIFISNSTETKNTCMNLRRTLKDCPPYRLSRGIPEVDPERNFASSRQQEAQEFLTYIFELFNIETMIMERRTVFSNDNGEKLKGDSARNVSFPIIPINIKDDEDPEPSLEKYINRKTITHLDNENLYKDGLKTYNRIKTYTSHTTDSLYIFYVNRIYIDMETGDKHKTNKKINVPENIDLSELSLENKELRSVVVHYGGVGGGHYVAYVKYINGDWYLYDDMSNELYTKVDNDISENKDILSNGVLFFYN